MEVPKDVAEEEEEEEEEEVQFEVVCMYIILALAHVCM